MLIIVQKLYFRSEKYNRVINLEEIGKWFEYTRTLNYSGWTILFEFASSLDSKDIYQIGLFFLTSVNKLFSSSSWWKFAIK